MRLLCASLLSILCLAATPAAGLTFHVNTHVDAADLNPGDGICDYSTHPLTHCGLRTAIHEANEYPGPDVVSLPAGTYALTLTGPPESNGLTGDLNISDDLTIVGAGADVTVIDGSATGERILAIVSVGGSKPNVEITGITFANADTTASGAAIFSTGHLLVVGCWFRNNRTTTVGGAVTLSAPGASGGTVNQITDTTFSGNSAGDRGGALWVTDGSVNLNNVTFSRNRATNGGGAVLVGAFQDLHVRTSTFTRNEAPLGSAVLTRSNAIFTSTKTLYHGDCAHEEGVPGPFYGGDGGNLESPGETCFGLDAGDQVSVPESELLLGVFANYGGPMPTHLPSSQSPAVDPPLSFAICPPTDQRGEPHDDGSCDVGAVERQPGDGEPPIFLDGFESGDSSMWS